MDNRTLLIQGDARHLPLTDASVHCCITSPPYWSLRDYGIAPSIWNTVDCEHEWNEATEKNATNHTDKRTPVNQGAICQKCGAWFGCLGLEPTPELYIAHLVEIFREVRRVLRGDGVLFLNIGDSYNQGAKGAACGIDKKQRGVPGLKEKDLVGIPWMLAFALRADGWYLRQEIIWAKPNQMPESVTDRCTKSHEQLFLLTKNARYFYDADAIREPVTSTGGASFGKQDHDASGTMAQSRRLGSPEERNHPLGRNRRSVWHISTQSCPDAHFATYPIKLVTPCIKAGTSEKGCCRECGAPWKRVVDRVAGSTETATRPKHLQSAKSTLSLSGNGSEAWSERGSSRVTTAWVPTCRCATGDPIPCTVLDCFNGAATTGIAAEALGRSYIGVERKAEYLEISRNRLAKAREKRAERCGNRRRIVIPAGVPTLFDGTEAA